MYIIIINYLESMNNNGIGRHVKNTDNKRNDFRPQTSDRAPSNGAERNDNIPCIYVCTYMYVICMYICLYIRMYVCIYVRMYVHLCMYLCMYVCQIYHDVI